MLVIKRGEFEDMKEKKRTRALDSLLREETHNQEDVNLNPDARHWMDIFHNVFLVKNVLFD